MVSSNVVVQAEDDWPSANSTEIEWTSGPSLARVNCKGTLSAIGTDDIRLDQYDLVALAMQEPQYSADVISKLLKQIGERKLPCMSIMNMPPLAYIARIKDLDTSMLIDAYTKADVWQYFDPANITLCSPDPQAFRPPDEPINVLQVGLPTNFKVARFDSEDHTKILRDLQKDIEEMFAHPTFVLKDGIVVVDKGKINNFTWGKTHTVKPDYDKSIEKSLSKFFDKYHTIALPNYTISNDEMSEVIGSGINEIKCSRKRIS